MSAAWAKPVKKSISRLVHHGDIRGIAMNIAQSIRALAATAPLAWPMTVNAVTPAEQLAFYSAQAGEVPSPMRGRQFFTTTHGSRWSCASCHGTRPTTPGRHAATGKTIAALAPAANAERFSDSARTEKWFRRNCNDVLGRECSAGEKADALAWLLSLQP
jgi:cytochrome c peroxidase